MRCKGHGVLDIVWRSHKILRRIPFKVFIVAYPADLLGTGPSLCPVEFLAQLGSLSAEQGWPVAKIQLKMSQPSSA